MTTLSQVIAQESAARAEANKRLGGLAKSGQKAAMFNGFDRTYEPFSETDDEARTRVKRLPPEGTRVQLRAEGLLGEFLDEMKGAVNLARFKDDVNCEARADVVADGELLLAQVPATHLLHMEKVLADLGTFIAALPVEDPTEEWLLAGDGLRKTAESFTVRNAVRKVPLVLHPGTDKHAPQVTVIDETVPEGRWTTVKYTGALTAGRKRELERRVSVLRGAFKVAREEANRMEALPSGRDEASVIAGYILG